MIAYCPHGKLFTDTCRRCLDALPKVAPIRRHQDGSWLLIGSNGRGGLSVSVCCDRPTWVGRSGTDPAAKTRLLTNEEHYLTLDEIKDRL